MERLIPILNKLQDVTAQCKLAIELPQIVVVGSQSSGKSSVLESLVGRDFLPRGSGIVTRRPLILQLRKEDTEEWGEFGHIPGERFSDFREILKEIESATRDVTGDRGISSAPINLKIHSPKVVDITLVDLPGITKVPVGDQPRNIEELIRNMILEYITSPDSVILAITAANSDLANSDALKLAKEVDPEGVRTIGVLTKIDLMDRGTDALEMLENRVYPLRLGYVGVVCRSQEDITKKVQMRNHLSFEKTFFTNHPKYSKIAGRLGTDFLAKRLNSLLISHLKERLPLLKKRVSEMLVVKEAEMRSYGMPLSDSPNSQGAILLNILQKFQKAYADIIEGRAVQPSSSELEGGARINRIFNTEYKEELEQMSPFDDLSDMDIRTTLLNSTGIRQALFIPESAFEILAKKQVVRLLDPSLRCAERVYQELQDMIYHKMDLPELERFQSLREALMEVVNDLLRKCLKPTIKMITNLVEIEQAYINIQHPDFIGGSAALSAVNQEMAQRAAEEARLAEMQAKADSSLPQPHQPQGTNSLLNLIGYRGRQDQFPQAEAEEAVRPQTMQVSKQPTNREVMETEVVKKMLDSYFSLVRTNISDLVPKTITCKMVNKSMTELHAELVSRLYKPELYEELMAESGDIPVRRMHCQEEIRRLQQAHEVLAEVREYSE
jgi:dynamin 1-like protein